MSPGSGEMLSLQRNPTPWRIAFDLVFLLAELSSMFVNGQELAGPGIELPFQLVTLELCYYLSRVRDPLMLGVSGGASSCLLFSNHGVDDPERVPTLTAS